MSRVINKIMNRKINLFFLFLKICLKYVYIWIADFSYHE